MDDNDIEWWEHYCPKQDDVMSFPKGIECDWCGAREDDEEVQNFWR